jgi:acetyltransferase-like isoleucine patch superfamily enzyme
MSSPTSTKLMHVLYINPKIRRKYIFGYIIHIWFSLVPVIFMEVGYYNFWNWSTQTIPTFGIWIPILLFPLNLLIAYYLLIFTSILIMKIWLFLLIIKHQPREGIFPIGVQNKDFKFLSLRNLARLFPSYLIASTPFPFFRRILFFSAFNIKIGKKGINRDIWITPEFIEIGENVIIGQATSLLSSYIEQDKLIIKKITIADNSIIGSKSTILPGVTISKNSIISAGSYLLPFQSTEEGCVYNGNPAEKVGKRSDIENQLV